MTVLASTAIIGAGLAGVTCARLLADAGHAVQLFDKGRGVAGRMSTRRAHPYAFDHGAQYFTVRDPAFLAVVQRLATAGVLAQWPDALYDLSSDGQLGPTRPAEVRYIGTPSMAAMPTYLAAGLPCKASTVITSVEPRESGFEVLSEDGCSHGQFERVVIATPAPQALPLLRVAPAFQTILGQVTYDPCWALMLGFTKPIPVTFSAAVVDHPILSWMARNASKRGRANQETWVLHGTAAWSQAYLEATQEQAAATMLKAFQTLTGAPEPEHCTAHRWRYARVRQAASQPYLWDSALGLGACGDFGFGPRVESAFMSARALVTAMVGV